MENANAKKHTGGCHCGAVRFEVTVDATSASRCNCSICQKLAFLSSIVKPSEFQLLTEESKLSAYEWGGKTARRFFCTSCGVHCFGRGFLEQVGGDYVSINVNALDDVDPATVKVVNWDGRHNNWQAGPRPEPWPVFPA
jgi:hypothetical protein